MVTLTGPVAVPREAVVLRVGFGEGPPVDGMAVRELVLAAIGVVTRDRWLLVQTESWLAEFAWEAAGHIGTRRHVRFLKTSDKIPSAVTVTATEARGAAIVAEIVGGSPAAPLVRVPRSLPFGTTGGRSAEQVAEINETDDVRRILRQDIVYAPRLWTLLGPGGFAPEPDPPPISTPPMLTQAYDARFSNITLAEAEALAKGLSETLRSPVSDLFPTALGESLQALLGARPLLAAVVGSSVRSAKARDTDLVILLPIGSRRQHLVGYGYDITAIPVNAWEAARHSGDLFAWSITGGCGWKQSHEHRFAKVLFRDRDLDEGPNLEPSAESVRQQSRSAMDLGGFLVSPTSDILAPHTWSRRAKWVVRTLCTAVAAWHRVPSLTYADLAGWLGGAAALQIFFNETTVCARGSAREALRECLLGLGAATEHVETAHGTKRALTPD